MAISTNTIVKKICFLGLMLMIAACSSKVEKTNAQGVATFFVDNIDGNSEISKIDSSFSLPKERLYSFHACLKDVVQSKAIIGHSFTISGGESLTRVQADEQGCLNWSEHLTYNFLAEANYVQTTRLITANGVHQGQVKINLALNPWSHGEDTSKVIDPSKKALASLLTQSNTTSALMAQGLHTPLWAINPRVTIVEKEFTTSGAKMNLKYQTKLSLALKNSAHQNIQYPLSSGTFDIEMFLYNSVIENGVSSVVALASSSLSRVTFTQDTLIAEFPFDLNSLPSKGQIFLGIKISAPGNELGIDPFEGIYMISDKATMKLDTSPSLATGLSFQGVKSLVNKQVTPVKEGPRPGVEIDKLDIRFFKIGSENTTDRQVFFTVKACMRSNLDSLPIKEETFVIRGVSSQAPITLKSNLEGCVSWDDSLWHKFFGKEGFVKKTVSIINENYNLNKQFEIALNPWDNSGNFGRDLRFVDDRGSLVANPSLESAKISIDSYSFSVNKYNYEINKNLDLGLIKQGTLSLNAKVVNHSSTSYGRMGIENLRDGKYFLKWAVVSVDKNNHIDGVMSSGQKVVNVFGGDVKADIAMKISAFEKLNIRSKLIIALYTARENKNGIEIDRNSGLEATPFVSSIILNDDQSGQKMLRLEDNLGLGNGDVFDRIASIASGSTSAQVATEKVLASQNLRKLNVSNENETLFLRDGLANPNKYFILKENPAYFHQAEQKSAISSEELMNFAKSGKMSPALAKSFCAFWFNDYFRRLKSDLKTGPTIPNVVASMAYACMSTVQKEPSKFFSIEKKLMVKKVGKVKYLSGTSQNLSVGNSFNVSNAESTTKSQTWSWSSSVGLSFDFFDFFRVGTNGSYAVSSAKSKSNSSTNSAQINSSSYLNLQASTFEIELSSYEECVAIRLNPELFSGANARFGAIWNSSMKPQDIARVATSGFFICSGVSNNTPIVKKENYYLITKDPSSSHGEQDAYSSENQQLNLAFRGEKDLQTFMMIIEAKIRAESSNNGDANFVSKKTLLPNQISLPTWPGSFSE